eukprot:5865069-Pyramimonas_sp.AAC.1
MARRAGGCHLRHPLQWLATVGMRTRRRWATSATRSARDISSLVASHHRRRTSRSSRTRVARKPPRS